MRSSASRNPECWLAEAKHHANFSIKSDARPVMSLKITQNAATSQPCPCITLSYFSFSSSSSHISPLAPTFHFTGVFAQKCYRWKKQKKKNHKQGWDWKLLWMIVIINHLCMIYTSFPVQMYRITLCKKKLNMYAITGLVDKNTGYSSITTDRKIKLNEMQ